MRHLIARRLAGALVVLVLGVVPGLAHPHIWVDTYLSVVFDDAGRIIELKQHWVFDEAFSAWVTQGLDVNNDGKVGPDEEQELANDNLSGLEEFQYYTFAGEGESGEQGSDTYVPAGPGHMQMIDGRNNFWFSLVPTKPPTIRKDYGIEVVDPEFYVDFTFPGSTATVLENAPPGCTVVSSPPRPLDDETAKRLAAIGPVHVELPPDLQIALQDQTNIALISCPNGSARTGEERTITPDFVAAKSGTPLTAPPRELNLPMPKTGFFGWINEQQKTFYKAMSKGLSAFRSDTSAFPVLGLLSFLYGIFHAAGPGHGKVVVSSYMLAGERQLKNGIALSFAAALAQSLTAIVFVLVAAAVLNMTSIAMSGAAISMERVSYALIIVLGLWFLIRKLTGRGHGHDHHHHDKRHHEDQAHADHGHHHVVVPKKGQNIREALGMVLAVGLRPCSGALIVLVFALSQGVLFAGIAAVLLMGLGTALTVSLLAILAVGAKALALKIGARTEGADHVVFVLEILGALLLVLLGTVMLVASLGG